MAEKLCRSDALGNEMAEVLMKRHYVVPGPMQSAIREEMGKIVAILRNETIEDCALAIGGIIPGCDYKIHEGRLVGDLPFQETLDAIRALKEA